MKWIGGLLLKVSRSLGDFFGIFWMGNIFVGSFHEYFEFLYPSPLTKK
jgi:hypothetical protein